LEDHDEIKMSNKINENDPNKIIENLSVENYLKMFTKSLIENNPNPKYDNKMIKK